MSDTEEKRIVISVDQQAADRALKSIKGLEKSQSALNKEVKQLDTVAASAAAAIKKASRENQSLATSSAEVNRTIKSATAALADYDSRLREVKASGTDLSGDIASSIGGIRGGLGAVGLGGVASPALEVAEGFADLAEFAPRLNVQLEAVGNTLRSGTGAASGFVSQAGDAVSSLLGVSGSVGSLLTIAAPAGLAIGAVALALSNLSKEQEKQATIVGAQIDAIRSINLAIADGLTTEEAEAMLEDIRGDRQAELDSLAQFEASYANFVQSVITQTGDFANFIGGIFGGLGNTGQGGAVLAAQQLSAVEEEVSQGITEVNSSIASMEANITLLENRVSDGSLAANDLAAAEAELAETREAEAQRAIQAAELAAQQVARLEQQRSSLIENRVLAEANANQLEAFDRRIALQDEKKELVDHQDELKAIRQAGADKIAAIDSEIAALPNQLASALSEAANKGNAQLSKLQSSYYAEQIKATNNFAKEQGRIATDTAKAAKRLAEDIADNLADAVRDNDVVAFLKTQADGQKNLRRNAEDASEAEKRRTEDFLQQQEEQSKAFQARQAEILAGIDEERARIQQSFIERRAALDAQRQAELAATQQAIANAVARFNQQEALEAQEASRKAQRQAIIDSQQEAAFQRELGRISQEIAGIGQIESAYISSVSRVVASISAISAGSKSASSFYNKPSAYQSPYQSAGFQKAGAGNGGVTVLVTNNNTVGDIATGSQVSAALNEATGRIYSSIISGIQKAQG